MSDFRHELLAVFEAEHKEHLAVLRGILDAAAHGRPADLREASRRAHTLKGAARAVDLPVVERLAHALEGVFERIGIGEQHSTAPRAKRWRQRSMPWKSMSRGSPPAPSPPRPEPPWRRSSGSSVRQARRRRRPPNARRNRPPPSREGLGLSMVYGLAQQSGGTVAVASAPGEGTTVEIFLPRSTQAAVRPGQREAVPPAAARPARILVVDDDPGVREVTSALLRDLGHRVREAVDGEAALRILEENAETELLVTDVAMPLMTGREVALRARAIRPGLPVLLVTGHAELSGLPGDMPILRKPFDPVLLAELVARLTTPG